VDTFGWKIMVRNPKKAKELIGAYKKIYTAERLRSQMVMPDRGLPKDWRGRIIN